MKTHISYEFDIFDILKIVNKVREVATMEYDADESVANEISEYVKTSGAPYVDFDLLFDFIRDRFEIDADDAIKAINDYVKANNH